MANNYRREQPGRSSAEQIALWAAIIAIVVLVAVVDLAAWAGNTITGNNALPKNPWALFFGVLGGQVPWPLASTIILIAAVLAAGVGGFFLWRAVKERKARKSRVDHTAKRMGVGEDIESITQTAAQASAMRFGVAASPGVPIGVTLNTNQPLFGSWEDMHIDIWGPRTGKTTSRAIPAILAAPGAVLVTSNKRDVVDATRDVREANGPVWVFDPQSIALEEPTRWWWNPLSYVTDEVKAASLAGHFAAGSRPAGARTDAFFDPAGQDLLAGLLLAAALANRPITDVYKWLTDPTDHEAAEIIKANGTFDLVAAQLEGVMFAPDKQRGGIYGTAQQMAACLTNRKVTAWVTTTGDDDRRKHFDPYAFVREGGTLYSLSKEGSGSAGPLVTALTVAVVEAAEELASRSPGGRLQTPLLGVLDEAANVCRWRQLPDLYSHYGSRGIVLMTILQSWSQGAEVWGDAGIRKLWSASNVKVYGGGVDETSFLESMSKIIGQYDAVHRSVSVGAKGHRNVSEDVRRENIMDVSDLAALPRGRAVVFSSGNRPVMVRTQPWMSGPHADAVRASITAHDPSASTTITTAEADVREVETRLELGELT